MIKVVWLVSVIFKTVTDGRIFMYAKRPCVAQQPCVEVMPHRVCALIG